MYGDPMQPSYQCFQSLKFPSEVEFSLNGVTHNAQYAYDEILNIIEWKYLLIIKHKHYWRNRLRS